MLTARVIPCLDCRDGRVVKGVRFQNLRDSGSPVELAAAYEQQGADELVLLDISATPEGRRTAHDTVRAVRDVLSIPLTVGGGVRNVESAQDLLEAGADKVSVNTAAVADPNLLTLLSERFGRQCTVLAIDARSSTAAPSGYEVLVRSGTTATGWDAIHWAREAEQRGAGEILLTSFDRDGTRSGYDLPMLAAIGAAVGVPVIASGGVGTLDHLVEGVTKGGASAVLAASIFHFGEFTIGQAKSHMAAAGLPMRLT